LIIHCFDNITLMQHPLFHLYRIQTVLKIGRCKYPQYLQHFATQFIHEINCDKQIEFLQQILFLNLAICIKNV
jgi:hypothetical protein